jgi:hypothetical protein
MTKPRLLSNLPIEDLTSETDYLGIIDKGDLIKTFLIGNKDQFDEIKMFSLYGEWGSGKSSLMKYLEKELKGDFNTFFFEAWEFEKDENLAMSLLEYITSKNIDVTEQLCSDILKYGGRILRGLGKSIKLNIPLFPNGPGVELDPSAFVEEISKNEELTFYKALESFKTEFIRFEDEITNGDKPKYNIVFIDDLDRCEPEQVLNLLSAIKLFFTYGEKTIFFCGIDKKAVEQAVKTKYGEIVKANEYLEKIFDISFSMPEYDDLQKLINHYFDNTIYELEADKREINYKVSDFFQYLEFTNPRRVKKVLNKYQILRNIKTLSLPEKYSPFPNIDEKDGFQKSYFETFLVLYLIILHEFYPEYFAVFLDFNFKSKKYFESLDRNSELSPGSKSRTRNIIKNISISTFSRTSLKIISFEEKIYASFSGCIAPSNIEKLSESLFNNKDEIVGMIVGDNKIEILFYKYISENYINVSKDEFLSHSSLLSIKKLIKNAL